MSMSGQKLSCLARCQASGHLQIEESRQDLEKKEKPREYVNDQLLIFFFGKLILEMSKSPLRST